MEEVYRQEISDGVRLVTREMSYCYTSYRCLKQRTQRTCSSGTAEDEPGAIPGTARGSPPDQPQDGFTGTAVLKRNHVADFMTNVNIHLVCHAEGELDRCGLVDLRAHHAPVLVVDGKAVLGTPLRNLQRDKWERVSPTSTTTKPKGSLTRDFLSTGGLRNIAWSWTPCIYASSYY